MTTTQDAIYGGWFSTAQLIGLAARLYVPATIGTVHEVPVWRFNGYESAEAMRDYYAEQSETDRRNLAAEALADAGLTVRDLNRTLS